MEGVAISGQDGDIDASSCSSSGPSGDDVVGLVARDGRVANAQRVENFRNELNLAFEFGWRGGSICFVFRELLAAECLAADIECDCHVRWLLLFERREQH